MTSRKGGSVLFVLVGGALLSGSLGGCPQGAAAFLDGFADGFIESVGGADGAGSSDGGGSSGDGSAGAGGADGSNAGNGTGDAGNSGSAGGAGGAGAGGPAALFPGVWRAAFNDPNFGPGEVELILMNNGRFQQQTVYLAGSLVTVYGTYRVFPEQALLRLEIERGEPTEACGPLGCTPILYPAGESHAFTLTADGVLVLENINCAPGACVFAYVRVN